MNRLMNAQACVCCMTELSTSAGVYRELAADDPMTGRLNTYMMATLN